MAGKIEIICGPMFSGKTTELIRKMERFKYSKKGYLLFKPRMDTRYSDQKIVTHKNDGLNAISIETADEIVDICNKNTDIKNIGIDEIQFVSGDPTKTINLLISLKKQGYHIVISGLDMNWMGEPFTVMPNLLAIADNVLKLKAVCFNCGEDAGMSFKTSKSKNTIELGADDKYKSLCFICWSKNIDSIL